jgi:hypothetical protein
MEYDRFASSLRADYAGFAANLVARYLAAAAAGRGIEAVSGFRVQGLADISALLGRAIARTNDYLAPLGAATITDAREKPFLNQLRQIALKNLNDLIVKLMGGAGRMADVFNRPAGAVGLLLQKKLEAPPRLLVRDRAGRAWQAETFVASLARDFAYQSYLDSVIERLDAAGVDMVQVVYPDPTHEHHGMPLRLDEVGLIRKTIFHPNSNATLVPYVQAE